MARIRILYEEIDGKIVKTVVGRKPLKESYDAKVEVPFEKRVLDTYRDLESEGKLAGHFKSPRQAEFVRDAWKKQLGE